MAFQAREQGRTSLLITQRLIWVFVTYSLNILRELKKCLKTKGLLPDANASSSLLLIKEQCVLMNVISCKIVWWHGEHDPDKSPASWNYHRIAGIKSGWHVKPISVPCRLFRGWPCGRILNVSNQTHNSSSGLLSISRLDESTNVCILFLF